jgi:hypothetical protein
MDETLGQRVHREFCWFALVLLILMIGFAHRLVPGTETGGKASTVAAQPAQPGTQR